MDSNVAYLEKFLRRGSRLRISKIPDFAGKTSPRGGSHMTNQGKRFSSELQFSTLVWRQPMTTKLNIRTFIAGLVFFAAIAISAAPAQASNRSYSRYGNHNGFSISFHSSNFYGYGGHYQTYPRFYSGYQHYYPSRYGRHSYYNGHHQRRGHASRGHYRGHNRGHHSRGRRGRGHHGRHR